MKKTAFFMVLGCFLAVLSVPMALAQSKNDSLPQEVGPESSGPKTYSGYPIPRFVTLAKDKVVARTGPSLQYPIKWVYERKALPVEVIQEFDTWRKIRDVDGATGWVHQSLTSGARSVLVKGDSNLPLHKEMSDDSGVIAYFEPGAMAQAQSCHGDWCHISNADFDGYARRKFLWGIYDQEDFD